MQRLFFYTSDADIFPISESYFDKVRSNKLIIKSFDEKGYGYGNNRGKWAMCYMVANKAVWKEILFEDIIPNNIKDTISLTIETEIKKGKKYFENFNYIDEVYLRDRIKKWKYYKQKVIFIARNYSNTRIDRNNLNNITLINITSIIDIHLPTLKYDTDSCN